MRKRKYLYKMVSLVLIASIALSGCAKKSNDSNVVEIDEEETAYREAMEAYLSDASLSDSEKFDRFSEDVFKHDVALNTIDLHYSVAYPESYGIDDYEVDLGKYEPGEQEASKEEREFTARMIHKISRDELDFQQKIAYDILEDEFKDDDNDDDFYYYGSIFSALTGLHTQLPVLMSEYTFRREKDVQDYLELLSQTDESFQSYIVYENEKADKGLGQPDFAIDEVIDSCNEFTKDPEHCYLIETFDERIDALTDISKDKKREYKDQNKKLVTNDLMQAYRYLADEMEKLKGRATNDKGVSYFKDGKRYYEYLLRTDVGSDKDMDELRDETQEFIDSRLAKVYEIVQDDSDAYEKILAMDSLTDLTPEEIMEDLIPKCEPYFPDLPAVNYKIKYVPKAMEEHLNPAFYLTPPIDDRENNVIYINHKYEDQEDLYPLLAHEGYPGHLYQIVSSQGYDRPLIRNLFSFSGYTEGYATYAEYFAYTLVDQDKNVALLSQYDSMISLALSAYIDMSVNYYGWDEKQVYNYLQKYGYGTEETAKSIFEMVVEEPAEYLEYFVGFLEFMDLRDEARDKVGYSFDIREFHRFLMDVGPAPFYIVREYMQDWIEESSK